MRVHQHISYSTPPLKVSNDELSCASPILLVVVVDIFVTLLFLDGKHGVSDINYNNNTGKAEKPKFGAETGDVAQCQVTLNPGLEDELTVVGYREDLGRLLATVLAVLLTGGVLGLLLYWMKHWWLCLTQVKCPLEKATSVLIVVRIEIYFLTPQS